MTSAVDICNLALNLLGEDGAVTSIDPPDGSVYASQCASFYPLALRRLLESGNWGFATKREYLARLPWVDVAKYNTHIAYVVPPDCLKVVGVTDSRERVFHGREADADFETAYDAEHRREIILTEAHAPVLVYTANVTNPTLFPAYFVEALVLLLATYLYGPVKRSDQSSAACVNLMKQYESALSRAKNLDTPASTQRRSAPRIPSSIRSRWV